ncbi:Hypothetical_protein [Hexamita inflata]|uniref:Hypothetical_protein n=1 Tax=Hexamita inflata TaxID=28002 RepID=A0AA86NPD8_9EUKA|nr:Hypothetical protein HINF_LOCUS10944 [Hexamita inflata]
MGMCYSNTFEGTQNDNEAKFDMEEVIKLQEMRNNTRAQSFTESYDLHYKTLINNYTSETDHIVQIIQQDQDLFKKNASYSHCKPLLSNLQRLQSIELTESDSQSQK